MKDQLEALIMQMYKSNILYSEAVREFKKRFILTVLQENKGNQCRAARQLGRLGYTVVQAAGPVLLGETFQLGVDRLIELPRQQHRRVPVDIGDGEDRRGAEQRKIGQR